MTKDELSKLLVAVQEGRINPSDAAAILEAGSQKLTSEPPLPANWQDVPISRMGIHQSAVTALDVEGIRTLGDLSSYTEEGGNLLGISGIDLKRSDDIGDKIASFWKSHPEYQLQSDAYDEGYDAYGNGVEVSGNPHDEETEKRRFWEEGWRTAQEDDCDESEG